MRAHQYIAISTGQNIANIAPLLAHAQSDARVVFISTAEAKRQGWTDRAFAVLRRHKYTQLEELVLAGDTPLEVFRAASQAQWSAGPVVILGNGGTKLQLLALTEALRARRPALLYSLDRPCRLEWYETDSGLEARPLPYARTRLDLEDVVALRGLRLYDSGTLLYWDGQFTAPGERCTQLRQGYGRDSQATFRLHDAQYAEYMRRFQGLPLPELPRWKALCIAHPVQALRFRRTMAQVLQLSEPPGAQDQRVINLFNSAAKVITEVYSENQAPPAPPTPLGPVFEAALRARVCRALVEDAEARAVLQAVYSNVKVDSPAQPGVLLLEIDLLFLLKNGLLLAIEAKSHTADTKDLDARLLNLQRAGSQLARVAVCSPIYTQATDRAWFEDHEQFARKVRDHGLVHLAFTLPGQPAQYVAEGQSTPRPVPVAAFEESLRRFLQPYVPSSTQGL